MRVVSEKHFAKQQHQRSTLCFPDTAHIRISIANT